MEDVYRFTKSNVLKYISKNETGVYFLGKRDDNNEFIIKYIGRSDTRLRKRLLDHLGEKYTYFSFKITETILEAYKIECREWHNDAMPLDNEIHPRKPKNLNYKCPYCKRSQGGYTKWKMKDKE